MQALPRPPPLPRARAVNRHRRVHRLPTLHRPARGPVSILCRSPQDAAGYWPDQPHMGQSRAARPPPCSANESPEPAGKVHFNTKHPASTDAPRRDAVSGGRWQPPPPASGNTSLRGPHWSLGERPQAPSWPRAARLPSTPGGDSLGRSGGASQGFRTGKHW